MRASGATLALALSLAMLGVPLGSAGAQPSDRDETEDTTSRPPLARPDSEVVVEWVRRTRDNHGRPYIIIDKSAAWVQAFDGDGELVGETPALIGSAWGDTSAPGIGDRELRDIAPEERTTPAGRFVARLGPAYGHKQVIWVDFSTNVSLHPVVTANKKEHRLQRLATQTPDDNRITYGCINVASKFYSDTLAPLLKENGAIVYVLPEEMTLAEVFWPRRSSSNVQVTKADEIVTAKPSKKRRLRDR